MKRTDIHRPSAIIPSDYEFVACQYSSSHDAIATAWFNREAMEKLNAHRERTGGTFSRHTHGGTCHICGAGCANVAYFYHAPSGDYIITGFDCADKLDLGDQDAFQAAAKKLKRDAKAWRDFQKGKARAEGLLEEAGLSAAWDLSRQEKIERQDGEPDWHLRKRENAHVTLSDVVDGIVRRGGLSEKQVNFLHSLVRRINAAPPAPEPAPESPAPEGRVEVEGEVVSTKVQESVYGEQFKMLVRASEGWKVWTTIPASISPERGSKVRFTATLKPSNDDPFFAFGSRPAKASIL